MLPKPPDDEEKHLYIHRNLFFLATTMVIGASTVIISQVDFETHNPLPWPFVVFTVTFFAYQVISLPVNFTGSGFDLAAHELRVRTWNPVWYPSVDIYLPICGEPKLSLPGFAFAYAIRPATSLNGSPGLTISTCGETMACTTGAKLLTA